MNDSECKSTETVLRLFSEKPIEEHVGPNDEDSKGVQQHLDVWNHLIERNIPFCLGGI